MSTLQEQPDSQNENTYMLDPENSAEMARLMRQENLVTQGMGGLFPEGTDLTNVHRILDLACGPGGWVLETAFAHSDIEVVGVDISEKMIAYARAQAKVQTLENASFRVMNILKPLDFPNASFDLVNARVISTFMLPDAWPRLLQECLRILRPGGILRFTEIEWGFSNKFAYEKICGLSTLALQKAGQSFSPTGSHVGVVPMLRRFVHDAGFQNIGRKAHEIEFSYGTESHEGFYHDFASLFKLLQPFLIKWAVATQQELDELYQQVLVEMQSEDFCGDCFLLTVWGTKPD
jgi:SAM-dependent methyltransferase